MKLSVVSVVVLAIATLVYSQPKEFTADVRNLRVVNLTSNYIKLAWDAPTEPNIDSYELKYFTEDKTVNSTGITTKEYYEISNLTLGVKYGFQVRSKSFHGWGNYSEPLFAIPGGVIEPVTSASETSTTTEELTEKASGATEATDGLKPGLSQADVKVEASSASRMNGFIAAYLMLVIFCIF